MIATSRRRKAAAIGVAGMPCTLSATTNAAGDWNLAFSPLFPWGLSIDGDASIDGNTTRLDFKFKDDILANMEAVFTIHFEARRDRLSFFTEYQYVDLEPDIVRQAGPINVKADVDINLSGGNQSPRCQAGVGP